jgi:peptide/nickel transport system permease protein
MTAADPPVTVTLARRTRFSMLVSTKTGRLALTIGIVALVVLLLPLLLPSPYDANFLGTLKAPSRAHPFGTDNLGRDMFSRVITGAHVSWLVAVAASTCSLLFGGAVGGVAALSGRRLDGMIMRLVDVVLAFPATLLAIVLASAIGSGITTVIVVVAFVYSAPVARLVRGLVRKEMRLEYVEAAYLIGTNKRRILTYHVGINLIPTLLVYQMTVAADAILVEAGLSYLGIGVNPPTPSWGGMIRDGQDLIFSNVWWVSFFPGVAIALTALALNKLADSVLDDLSTGR